MFETSQTTEKLDSALAKVQGEVQTATKDAENPHFRSKYADLQSVWDACRQALSKHGVSVTQWLIHSTDNRAHIMTRVAHSGEWMRSSFSIPVSKQDAHGYGSAVTYLRRFALGAAIGVVAGEDDDDGDGSIDRPPPRKNRQGTSPQPTGAETTPKPPIVLPSQSSQASGASEAEIKMAKLKEVTARRGWTAEQVKQYVLVKYKTDRFAQLSADQFAELCRSIEIMTYITAMKAAGAPAKTESRPSVIEQSFLENDVPMFDEPGMGG